MKHLHRLFVSIAFIGFIGCLLLTGSLLDFDKLVPLGLISIILMCGGLVGDLMIPDFEVYKGDGDDAAKP